MSYESIYQNIMDLPVFDTHTHLETGWRQSTKGLYARNFFDICRYFWFQREQQAAGYYPAEVKDGENEVTPERAEELHEALRRIRNTYWTRTVMEAMENLYGIRPDSVDRILELSEAMGKNLSNREWGNQVCDKIGIRKTVMGPGGTPQGTVLDADVDLIADRIVRVPAYRFGKALKGFDEVDAHLKVDEFKEQIKAQVESYRASGYRAVRAAWPFLKDETGATQTDFSAEELKDKANLSQHLGHFLFRLLEEHGSCLQIFFGMGRSGAQNDTTHVSSMHGIFKMYPGLTFNLFCAAELSSLDMVQAARIYPNVYPGGLWWFTFRRSVYESNMQYRVEALPASRASFVASDARCIEWSYIKILLIKKVMARFFHNQIEEGWLDEDAALYTARHWLHDTAEQLYCPE